MIAYLLSLRPIFTLIKTGTAQSDRRGDSDLHNNAHDIRSRATISFTSRGLTAKAFSGTDKEDKNHPFSIINDRKNILERGDNPEDHVSTDPSVSLEELQPPLDKVMVRDDISVNYSSV